MDESEWDLSADNMCELAFPHPAHIVGIGEISDNGQPIGYKCPGVMWIGDIVVGGPDHGEEVPENNEAPSD